MKDIMKRAWEIYKTLKGSHMEKLSAALKAAWTEFKQRKFSGCEEREQGWTIFQFRLLEKGGHKRIYINYSKSNSGVFRKTLGFYNCITRKLEAGSLIPTGDQKDLIDSFLADYAF